MFFFLKFFQESPYISAAILTTVPFSCISFGLFLGFLLQFILNFFFITSYGISLGTCSGISSNGASPGPFFSGILRIPPCLCEISREKLLLSFPKKFLLRSLKEFLLEFPKEFLLGFLLENFLIYFSTIPLLQYLHKFLELLLKFVPRLGKGFSIILSRYFFKRSF